MNKKICINNNLRCLSLYDLRKYVKKKFNIDSSNKNREYLIKKIFKDYIYLKVHPTWSKKTLYMTDLDIYNVLIQYNGKNNFIFLGIFIINKDNDKIINLYKKYKSKNIGIILYYNFHWVALWISNNIIRYMDSEGIRKLRYKYIVPLIYDIRSIYGNKMKISYNFYDIQEDKYNCGLYVINFILMNFNIKEYDDKYQDWLINFDKYENKRNKYFILK